MAILKITAPNVPEPPGSIFSNCLMVGKQIFISGMVASGGPGGTPIGGRSAYLQSRACLRKVSQLLEAAGLSVSDVVKLTVYLTDMSKRLDFGRASAEFFSEPMPCSTMIEVKSLAQPSLMVEVDVIAVPGASSSPLKKRSSSPGPRHREYRN
jgi:enamine deaminase RidA (YjgF/YER057c/UK114 family)